MTRRLALLAALAVATALGITGIARTSYSHASFTTASQTDVRATTEAVTSWLWLWSQATDKDVLTGYAVRRQQTGTPPPCATGGDTTLTLDMGTMRANNTTYTFNRTFTMHTATTYPDTAVTQATVTATYVADPATGLQPIRDVRFSTVGATGGSSAVTLAANQKRQANVRLRLNSVSTPAGTVLHPKVRLTLTYTGSPASYFVYDIPLTVTIGTW